MTANDRETRVANLVLHRREWLPESPARAAVAIIHGHGDAVDRYECSVAPLFTSLGIACTGLDFPGHGRSPGRRGDIPGFAFTRAAITEAFHAAARLAPGCPVGLFAHSMGGLVTLDWLASPETTRPAFLWLSSPLLDPSHRQPKWKLRLANTLARLAPWLILDSGVRTRDCRGSDPAIPVSPANATLHSRIRAGWGFELLERAKDLPLLAKALPIDLPLLLTQGLADRICPPRMAAEFFQSLPCTGKTFVEFPGGLHELFDDSTRPAFLAAGTAWLSPLLASV